VINRLIVVRTQPLEQALAYNQATVATYDETTMGDVRLVVEITETDARVNDCVIFGFVNELGVATQIASIDDVAAAFGFEEERIASELRSMTRGLVEALS
jgi:hypothetical protein